MAIVKVDVYQCDNCESKFIDSEELINIEGKISCDDKELVSDCMLCYECALEILFTNQDRYEEIENVKIDMIDTEDVAVDEEEEDNEWEL